MRIPFLFLIALFVAGFLHPALRAQGCVGGTVTVPCVPDDNSPDEVVLLSGIVAPYTGGITSYSYTAVGASISTYYDGYVSACLYKDATQLTCNANQGNPANVQLQAATVTGHTAPSWCQPPADRPTSRSHRLYSRCR